MADIKIQNIVASTTIAEKLELDKINGIVAEYELPTEHISGAGAAH